MTDLRAAVRALRPVTFQVEVQTGVLPALAKGRVRCAQGTWLWPFRRTHDIYRQDNKLRCYPKAGARARRMQWK